MFKHFEILNDIECYNMYSEYTPAVNLDYITYMQLRVASPVRTASRHLILNVRRTINMTSLNQLLCFSRF